MIKLFDYKFLITLGLSLVVYFLYREVDILNKRIAALEKTGKETKPKIIIDLPSPPSEENIQSSNKLKINNINNMVEEYSNENVGYNENVNIYSHDNLETNSNDQDSLMVDSILNMVKIDTSNKKNTSTTLTKSESSAIASISDESDESDESLAL